MYGVSHIKKKECQLKKKQRFKKETSIQKCQNPDTPKNIVLFVNIIKQFC